MRIGRWPLVVFTAIAVPLAVYGEPEGVVGVALPLAIVVDMYICATRYPVRVAGVYVVSNALVVIALVRSLTSDIDPFVRRFDETALALLVSSRTLAYVCTVYRIAQSTHATVVRTYAYCTMMLIVQLLGILHVRELAKLLATFTLDDTTRAACVIPDGDGAAGFLFADSPFVSTCPTRVWEHIRVNSLFASQLYVLYTLTTDLGYNAHRRHPSSGYAIGMLALLECTTLAIAVGVQFDIIAGCHQVSWGVGSLLVSAAVAYAVRRLYTTPDQVSASYSLPPCNQVRHVKLKL
jgi:hypothetical protein